MRAVVLEGPRSPRVVEVAEPRPGPGDILVEVLACGVCGSDLNAWRGVQGVEYPLPPGAPGHEVFGRVAAVGDGVRSLRRGECVTGLMWNGFAERTVARGENVVGCEELLLGEPLACAMNVVRRSQPSPGQRVAVVGFGYLAALVVQLLPEGHGSWVAISRRADSRALALALGAEAAYDFTEVPSTLWDSFPVVIEAAGVQQSLDFASWLVSYGGRLVIAGYHADGPRTVNMQTWNWKGIDVINAHEREPRVYVEALHAGLSIVRERNLDIGRLITHRSSFDGIAETFEALEQRPNGFVKAIIEP